MIDPMKCTSDEIMTYIQNKYKDDKEAFWYIDQTLKDIEGKSEKEKWRGAADLYSAMCLF